MAELPITVRCGLIHFVYRFGFIDVISAFLFTFLNDQFTIDGVNSPYTIKYPKKNNDYLKEIVLLINLVSSRQKEIAKVGN